MQCRAHHFTYTDGKYSVNEHFQRCDGPNNFGQASRLTHDKASLHHYVLKSREVESWKFRMLLTVSIIAMRSDRIIQTEVARSSIVDHCRSLSRKASVALKFTSPLLLV